MARSKFGGTSDDYVFFTVPLGANQVVSLASTVTLTFWTAAAGGTRYTDLLLNGSAVTSITTAGGLVPEFQGPDSITEMWADSGTGNRTLLFAQGQQGPAGPPGAPGGVQQYATATAYTTGQPLIAPDGTPVTWVTAGTSGASFAADLAAGNVVIAPPITTAQATANAAIGIAIVLGA